MSLQPDPVARLVGFVAALAVGALIASPLRRRLGPIGALLAVAITDAVAVGTARWVAQGRAVRRAW